MPEGFGAGLFHGLFLPFRNLRFPELRLQFFPAPVSAVYLLYDVGRRRSLHGVAQRRRQVRDLAFQFLDLPAQG